MNGSVGRAANDRPLVIYIQATRECRVRVAVDGMPLDRRRLQRGDEFFSRPRQQFLMETDDAGALGVTVNGTPVSLAPDGEAIAVRLTTERPYPERIPLP